MPGLSQEQFNRLESLLADPSKVAEMAPDTLARAKAATSAYRAESSSLIKSLDPMHPPMAQALSTQPATTHPRGDQEAGEDWIRGELNNPNGTVVVYDMPLGTARKRLLESPDIMPALGYSRIPPTPETIAAMDHNSSLYRAYNDHVWRQTADAAAKAGKTAYRYASAPYLQGGGLMQTLQGLGMKLATGILPATESVTAFVMGEDDTAHFGAGRAAAETFDGPGDGEYDPGPVPRKMGGLGDPVDDPENYIKHPTLGWVHKDRAPKGAFEFVGSATVEGGGDMKRTNELIAEDNPRTYLAGQVAGAVPSAPAALVKGAGKAVGVVSKATGNSIVNAGKGLESLAPWSASNELFDAVAKGGRTQLARMGLNEGVAPVATSALAGALASGATNVAQEGIDAGASLVQSGGQDAGTTFDAASERTLDALKFGGVAGGLGSVVQQGAGAAADWVREGNRYKKIPGQLERAGVEFEFGKGPVEPPAVAAAKAEAQKLDDVPVEEVLAEKVAPKLSQAVDDIRSGEMTRVKTENADFQASPEGKLPLPLRSFIDTAVTKLRGAMEKRVKGARFGRGEVPDPVGYKGQGREVKELFNQSIDDITLEPVEGAIKLTPEEAQAFLEPEKRIALRRMQPKKAPEGGPRQPFAPADERPLEAHRTVNVRGEPPAPPPLVEKAVILGAGRFRAPEGVLGEPLSKRRLSSPEPAPPPLIEGDSAGLRIVGGTEAPRPWLMPKAPHPRLNKAGRAELEKLSQRFKPGKEIPLKDWDGYIDSLRSRKVPDWQDDGLTDEQIAHIRGAVEGFGAQPGHVAKSGLDAALDRFAEDPSVVKRDRNATAVPRKFLKERVDRETYRRMPLADLLRKRGVETVYVVPRQSDAEHTETLIKAIDGYREKNPKNVDLIELDEAVRKDRDLRPRGGEAGGWSKLKAEQHERLNVADEVRNRVAPRGDAHEATIAYARGKAGAPRTQALRTAAEKAGATTELRQTRVPALMDRLANRTAPGHKVAGNTLWGAVTGLGDTMAIRGAYPVLKSLEGPLGPLGTGKAARVTTAMGGDAASERRTKETEPRLARYEAWRREKLRRKGKRPLTRRDRP